MHLSLDTFKFQKRLNFVECDQGGLWFRDEMGESGMRAFLSKKVLLFLWIVANHAIRGRGRLDPPRKVFRK